MTTLKRLLILVFVSTILFGCTKHKRKLKSEKVYEYYYKAGELAKEGRLDSETKYNANGKEEEELQYGLNDSVSIKTIYRYNNEGKLTEEAKFSDGRLYQKKLISYNELGKKDVVEFYQEEEGNLIRGAWLQIFHNNENKVSEKKWLGSIDYKEEYSWFSHTSYLGSDKFIDHMPDISKEDTTEAKYFYNQKGKLDRIELYNNHEVLDSSAANKLW